MLTKATAQLKALTRGAPYYWSKKTAHREQSQLRDPLKRRWHKHLASQTTHNAATHNQTTLTAAVSTYTAIELGYTPELTSTLLMLLCD